MSGKTNLEKENLHPAGVHSSRSGIQMIEFYAFAQKQKKEQDEAYMRRLRESGKYGHPEIIFEGGANLKNVKVIYIKSLRSGLIDGAINIEATKAFRKKVNEEWTTQDTFELMEFLLENFKPNKVEFIVSNIPPEVRKKIETGTIYDEVGRQHVLPFGIIGGRYIPDWYVKGIKELVGTDKVILSFLDTWLHSNLKSVESSGSK